MEKLKILISAFILLGYFYSCSAPATENKEKEENKEASKNEEKKETSKLSVVCKKEEKPGDADPVLIKTCTYGSIQTKSEGYPDMQGRYTYTYEIKLNGKKVKSSEIFNDKMPELLAKLNEKILKDYTENYNAEESKDCFGGKPKNPKFKMDELNIDFDDDNIIFNISFGLPDMCLAVDGTSVSVPLTEIEAYLKK